MSQQGERPTGHEDDWWRQLYDDASGDTGPAVAADSLDDRFASAANTVRDGTPHPTPTEPATAAATPTESEAGASGARGAWGAVPGTSGAWAAVPGTSGAGGEPGGRPGPTAGSGGGPGGAGGPGGGPGRTGGSGTGGGSPLSDRVPPQGSPGGPAGRGGQGRQGDPGPRPATPPDPMPAPPAVPPRPSSAPDAAAPADAGPGAGGGGGPGSVSPAAPPRPSSSPDPAPPTDAVPRGPLDAGAVSPGDAGSASPVEPVPRPPFAPGPRRPSDPPASVPARDPRLSGLTPRPAPWESPSVQPSGPVTFPPGPTPSGFHAATPWRRAPVRSPLTQAPIPAQPPSGERPASPPAEPSPTPRPAAEPSDARPSTQLDIPTLQADEVSLVDDSGRVRVEYVGSGPPTYDAEPTALPSADPEDLGDLVADTVLDGARYGACTLRAASLRGDSARYRGEPRRDALLTARFGLGEQALVLVAMATGARAIPGAHRAAAEACRWIGRAVGQSHVRLVEDIRAARRGDLKSGLHRLTDRSLGKLRASAVEQGLDPEEYTASLRCLLLPADPGCRTRVFFGVGAGGLFRLRGGEWQDIEPRVADTAGAPVVGFGSLPHETPEGDRLTMDLGITTPPSPYEPAPAPPREPFRFRASVAREDDVLLLCTGGLAEPLRGEPPLAEHLAARWGAAEPPGLAAFLADAQVRVKGYADDRTAAAVWEA
ncbi:protein phosphatase 2C domain-containing protein [Streptomyces akebiae]|uniref:Protein phosphatase 2C domain-containing protein n=1 Tax=Streptomyces akebiae TaxID=2865673 RepID=A0ABX8XLE5_9ACTN|nr:protein phosphatase 2C domain-containing protein [Streptomyces akebiae]